MLVVIIWCCSGVKVPAFAQDFLDGSNASSVLFAVFISCKIKFGCSCPWNGNEQIILLTHLNLILYWHCEGSAIIAETKIMC